LSHDPDYPYLKPEKAIEMAENVYNKLKRLSGNSCGGSFEEIRRTLQDLFSKEGTMDERIKYWKDQIKNVEVNFASGGDSDSWAGDFIKAANKVEPPNNPSDFEMLKNQISNTLSNTYGNVEDAITWCLNTNCLPQ
jgi:hypothetical protein